jgi:hypothetical protein
MVHRKQRSQTGKLARHQERQAGCEAERASEEVFNHGDTECTENERRKLQSRAFLFSGNQLKVKVLTEDRKSIDNPLDTYCN